MTIRPRYNSKGEATSWILDYGIVEGERKRERYADEGDARRALQAAENAERNLGLMGLQATPQDMADFMALKARLPPGTSMMKVGEFYMEKGLAVTRPVSLPELVRSFIWSRKDLNRGKRTIETYNSVLGSLALCFPLKQADQVTREDIKAWKRSQGWAGGTQNKAVGHARSLFKWAIQEHHAAENPCDGIEEVSVDIEEIEDLTLKECEQLLQLGLRVPRYMFYICLGLFRGMRRSEMEKLNFDDVDFEEQTAIAAAKKVKTRQRRVIEIPSIAMAWIRAAGWTGNMMETGCVAPANNKEQWPRFWRAAGLKAWPHNGLRHTFASMHYAMYGDESLLRSILGQKSEDVLHTNYRALKTKREAEQFWALLPPPDWKPLEWSRRDPVFKFVA